MAIEWEHKVGEIVERAGLLPRPNGVNLGVQNVRGGKS